MALSGPFSRSVCLYHRRLYTITERYVIVLFRNLPRNYPYNNAYSLFPFTVPSTARELAKALGRDADYDWERPPVNEMKSLVTRSAISHVFNRPQAFSTRYKGNLEYLSKGYG